MTLKEEIRARDHLFRVFIDITFFQKMLLYFFSFTPQARKSLIFQNSGSINYRYFTWIGSRLKAVVDFNPRGGIFQKMPLQFKGIR